MATSYLDKNGLLYFLQQIRPNATPQMDGTASTGTAKRFANQDHVHPSDTTKADKSATVSTVAWDSTNKKITKTINGTTSDVVTTATLKSAIGSATTSNEGLMTTTQVTKLNGIATGAEVNQNAFSNVKVGSTTVAADAKTDTLELVGGTNITLTPDATNDKVTIATSAEVNQNAFSNVKVGSTTVAADTKTDTLELVAGSNVTLTPDSTNDKVTIAATDTTYSDATTSTHGLMSTADKTKLDSIADQAFTITAGSNVQITANTSTNTLIISSTNTTYSGGTAAELTTGTSTTNKLWQPKIIADYVKSSIETAITGAAAFQGTAPTTFSPTNYKAGYYWVVGTAGTYVGQVCEAGDMIFAVNDYGTAYSASDFDVVQTNLDITAITNAEIDAIVAA